MEESQLIKTSNAYNKIFVVAGIFLVTVASLKAPDEIEDHRLLNVERYRLYEEEGRKLVAAGDEISIRESSIRRGLT